MSEAGERTGRDWGGIELSASRPSLVRSFFTASLWLCSVQHLRAWAWNRLKYFVQHFCLMKLEFCFQ